MITIEDIALEVGCSVNTVSRALNNKPDVSALTRKRVLEAAKRLGYVPNTLAKSLVTKSSGSIGVIVPSLINPVYAALVSAIEREAHQRQQKVFLAQSEDDPAIEKKVAEYFYQQRVDGLLIVPCSSSGEHLEDLHKALLPIVHVMYETGYSSPYVACNLKQAVGQVLCHLVEQGRKSVVLFSSKANTALNKSLYAGVALGQNSLKTQPGVMEMKTGITVNDGYHATLKLLQSNVAVDSILLHNDMLAPGVMAALTEHGKKCPQDVAVVGCGNMDFADYLPTPLTTVDMFPEDIGREAVNLIWQLINKSDEAEDSLPFHKIVQAEAILRASSENSYIRKDDIPKQQEFSLSLLYPACEG